MCVCVCARMLKYLCVSVINEQVLWALEAVASREEHTHMRLQSKALRGIILSSAGAFSLGKL